MKNLKAAFVLFALGLLAPLSASAQAVLREGDMVQLSIRGVPDAESQNISGQYRIDQNGRLVGLPHLAQAGVSAAGLTEGQLATRIAQAYRDAEIFTRATVSVLVDKPAVARRITVGGHATRPGPVEYYEGMTAFDAFSAVGGAARFGQIRRVFLHRDGREPVTLDLTRNEDKAVRLLPGDRLEVDRKGIWEP